MDRRKALLITSSLIGGTLVGAEAFFSGCTLNSEAQNADLFSDKEIQLLDEIGETILPQSDLSPGAKAANIGDFMRVIITDCYDPTEQEIFLTGITELQNRSNEAFGGDFLELSSAQRQRLLIALDEEVRNQQEDAPPHYFKMMKELTIWGYFTSEPGVTQALRYNPIPGRFEGCVDYQKGERAWY